MYVFGGYLDPAYAAATLLGSFVFISCAIAVCSLNWAWRHRRKGPAALVGGALLLGTILFFHGDVGRRWDSDPAVQRLRAHTRQLVRLGGLMVVGYFAYTLWRRELPGPTAKPGADQPSAD